MWSRDKKELDAECGKNPNPLTSSIQEMMARCCNLSSWVYIYNNENFIFLTFNDDYIESDNRLPQ